MDSLISTDWLAGSLATPGLVILDATYFLPELGRDARAEYDAGHIPGALFLDLATLVDDISPLPNTLPAADLVAMRLNDLGVGAGDRIVLYDNSPHRTAPRAWYVLRLNGIHDVAVLDGGFAKWLADGLPVERTPVASPTPPTSPLPVRVEAAGVRSLAQMKANVDSRAEQVVDARGAGRFTGEEPEIRPGMPSGHIPGARNLPYGRLFNADGSWKRDEALAAEFEAAGIDLSRPLVTTCGSGITASVLLFGAHLLGKQDIALYDGSWSEWAIDPSTPKATGPAA
mgnify:CR=1 FL=1